MHTTALRPLLAFSAYTAARCRAALAALLVAGFAASVPAQQADPPARAARIELAEGGVQYQTASDPQARGADPRWPLTAGDTVWTDDGARAELHTGASTLRLGGATSVGLTALDDRTTQLRLTAGTLAVQVRSLEPGERFEIDTPNLALVLARPGAWRIDVDPGQGLTRIAAGPGSAGTVYGENAESASLAGPVRRDYSGRRLASPAPLAAAFDDFDRWSEIRDRAVAQSPSARYVSADVPGVQQLDAYGDWQNDPSYGPVWFPRVAVADWAPYRYGRWESVAPWGWTWIDDAPWGFAPFHYGRWTQAGDRWGWVPGPVQARPAYAPALVGFIGNPAGGGGFQAGGGRPGVGWFPLAPGEAWRPPFSASPGYIARLNRAGFVQNNIDGYYYQTRPNAVTVLGVDDFGRRDAHRARFDGVTAADLARARAVQPPPWAGRGGAPYQGFVPRDRGPDRVGYGAPSVPGGYPVPGGFQGGGFPGPGSSIPQMLPPTAPLSERIQQQQWQRSQQMLEDRQRHEILRQQQLRGAQERFQPDASQRQLQMQREDMQLRQQRDEFERQRSFGAQRELMQHQQEQQRQQMQAQQQQLQMQQRQMQENQQRQQDQQQRQMQQAQQEQRQQMQRLQEQQRQQQQQLPQMQAPPPGAQRSPDGRAYRPPRAAPLQH